MQVCDSSSVVRVCRNGKALIAFYWLYLSHYFPASNGDSGQSGSRMTLIRNMALATPSMPKKKDNPLAPDLASHTQNFALPIIPSQ